MKTTNKSTKNSKKPKKEASPKKINWTPIIIILVCILVGFGSTFGIIKAIKVSKAKVLDIAFYQVPEDLVEEIKTQIKGKYEKEINFVVIPDNEYNEKEIARKYELFFSKNGSAVTKLDKYSQELNPALFDGMPSSLKRGSKKFLPIALDHYEVAYNKKIRNKANIKFPINIVEFQNVLKAMQNYVFSPFFCAGGDDDILTSFIGTLVESLGGTESYKKLIDLLTEKPSLAQNINTDLSTTNKKQDTFTLCSILDMLRKWQEDGLVHPNWFIGKNGDLTAFMEQEQIGVIYTSLSVHRTIPYKLISEYDADRMPVFSVDIDHGLIAPSIVAVKLTDSSNYDSLFEILVENKEQKNISMISKLGPVSSRAQAYDRQADDVRFLAASCKDGPLPALGDAVFQTNPEAKHKFAEEIRTYLRLGVLKGTQTK